MTTTQSYQNSDKIWYNEEHEQVQMIICPPVSQTLSVFSTSGSAAVIVCQKLSFLLKLWSHTYRCTRTASLFSFLQTSVPSFIRVLLFSASWWRTGPTADTQVLRHLSHLTEMNRQPESARAQRALFVVITFLQFKLLISFQHLGFSKWNSPTNESKLAEYRSLVCI